MAGWTQLSTALWCLFNSTTREVNSSNVTLEYLPLETTSIELKEEEVLLNCFDGS